MKWVKYLKNFLVQKRDRYYAVFAFQFLFNQFNFSQEKADEKKTNGEDKIAEKKAQEEDKIAEANISK